MISLAGLILVLLWIVPYIYQLFEQRSETFLRCSGGDAMTLFKVAVLGIVAVIFALMFKQVKAEYAGFITFGTGMIIFLFILGKWTWL